MLFLSAVMFLIPMGFHFSKLIGGSADFLHGLDVLAHGFHALVLLVFMSGQPLSFGPPHFRDNFLAGRFQIVQIPDSSIKLG